MASSASISRRIGKAITHKLSANRDKEEDDQPVLTTHRTAAEATLRDKLAGKSGAKYELKTKVDDNDRIWYSIGLEGHTMPPIPLSRSITNQQSSSQNANINNPDLDSAQASSTLHLPPSQPSPAPPPPTLAKPKSSPNLLDPNKLSSGRRPVDSFRAFSSMVPVGGQADVLGRLMGWGPVSAKERVEGSAKMETLPVRLSQDGETLPRESMSDFPGDLADMLGSPFGSLTASLENLSTPMYNSPNLSTTNSPANSASLAPAFTFGTNFSSSLASPSRDRDPIDEAVQSGQASQPTRSMREVASSETIRDSLKQRVPAHLPSRYEDPRMFDLLEHLDQAKHDNASAARLVRPARLSDHTRTQSTSSFASSASNKSRQSSAAASAAPSADISVDDRSEDPRLVVFGWNRDLTPAEQGVSLSQSQSSLGSPSIAEFGRRSSVAVGELDRPPSGLGSGPSSPGPASLRWHARRRSATGLDSNTHSVRGSISSVPGSPGGPKRERVVLAATVEWFIAELTAKNSPTQTINFFLTYRSYLRPEDLLAILLTRFEWALRHPSTLAHAKLSSKEASTARSPVGRVVAVRCHAMLRHWLLNHFADDWVDSKPIRNALPAWIKRMSKDSAIRDGPDYGLVTALAKVVRAVRDQYKWIVQLETTEARGRAAAAAKAVPLDFDALDLDLEPGAVPYALRVPATAGQRKSSSPGAGTTPIEKGKAGAKDAFGKLKKFLGKAEPEVDLDVALNDTHAFRASGTGDLLFEPEEMDKYLASLRIEQPEGTDDERSGVPVLEGRTSEDTPSDATLNTPRDSTGSDDRDDTVQIAVNGAPIAQAGLGISTNPPAAVVQFPTFASQPRLWEDDPYTNSPDPYGRRPVSTRIQLDDVDLSDDEPDVVEVKKTLKRLPGATDLRQANFAPTFGAFTGGPDPRMSIDTVSSYGAPVRGEFAAGRETVLFEDEGEDLLAAGAQFIPGFILEGINESDDEDAGDVEAALRRLEGIVDRNKEREKAQRVERQMEKSLVLQGKLAAARPAWEGDASLATTTEDFEDDPDEPAPVGLLPGVVLDHGLERDPADVAGQASQVAIGASSPPQDKIETIPSTGMASRRVGMGSAPSTAELAPIANRAPSTLPVPLGEDALPARSGPPTHRCFILLVRTEVLAAQFGLIERDMLRNLDWLELVSGEWARRAESVNVLDWQAYLKELWRQQYLARAGQGDRPSTVLPVIARFNLMTHWVASEIVLTANVDERAALVGRFVKLAFRCYTLKNFQTVAQLVHGLQLPEVEGLRRTWARVGPQEKRQLRLLKAFVGPGANWKLLRDGTAEALAPFGPLGAGQEYDEADAGVKGKGKPALVCLPFLGLFLRDLRALEELPTWRDPTDLAADARVTAAGELAAVANPRAFDDERAFPPLPKGSLLRPLVNAHKLRVQADVLEAVLRAKRWAAQTHDEAEQGMQRAVFVKCLRIGSAGEDVRRQLAERVEGRY